MVGLPVFGIEEMGCWVFWAKRTGVGWLSDLLFDAAKISSFDVVVLSCCVGLVVGFRVRKLKKLFFSTCFIGVGVIETFFWVAIFVSGLKARRVFVILNLVPIINNTNTTTMSPNMNDSTLLKPSMRCDYNIIGYSNQLLAFQKVMLHCNYGA